MYFLGVQMNKYLFSLASLSLICLSPYAWAGTNLNLYCFQVSPKASHGYIIDSALISADANKPSVILQNLGIGLLTEQGDGTSSDEVFASESELLPNENYRAQSAQWKDAVPFLLPMPAANPKTYVLYVKPEGFNGKKEQEFRARLKVTEGEDGDEKNFTLSCLHN